MFGKKCSLCGGKLDNRQVCTLCGLDNSKSDRHYRINQSDCDRKPLTHVHEEKRQKPVRTVHVPAKSRPKKKKGVRKVAVIIPLLLILFGILQPLAAVLTDVFSGSGEEEYYEDYEYEAPDPYEYVSEELPAEGTAGEYVLTSGCYIVGVHIPAGNYTAEMDDDFDVVQVTDYERGIYLYEYEGKSEENYLDDLRLYPGAEIKISSMTEVALRTENGREMTSMENPLTDGHIVTDSVQKAGEDFESGVYDIEAVDGSGVVTVMIYYEDGEECRQDTLYLGEDNSDGIRFCNLILPEGAEIYCESGMKAAMTPSPVIGSTDYMSFYTNY